MVSVVIGLALACVLALALVGFGLSTFTSILLAWLASGFLILGVAVLRTTMPWNIMVLCPRR
ncbi:MAG: hypothetical protein AAFV86_08090 [Pseudomonadota bacterium]